MKGGFQQMACVACGQPYQTYVTRTGMPSRETCCGRCARDLMLARANATRARRIDLREARQ